MTDIQILAVAIGGQTVVVLIGIAGGVLYSNSRITDLKDAMNKRFDDLRDLLRSEVKRIEDRIAHTRV
jgi:hypothetical protein